MNFAYDDIDLAERRRGIAALDFDIEELKAQRLSLARRLSEWGAAIEDLTPEEVAEHAAEIRKMVEELEIWGASLAEAENERREYGV